jgi:putative transposase
MSRVAMPYDNAVVESFFSSLKNELTHHEQFETTDAVRAKVFDYIEVFYNRQRKHESLGYRSPTQFESAMKCA